MKDRRTGFYKIGRSVDPVYREKVLQAQIPLVDLVEAWEGTNADETTLHRRFKAMRLRGEWFELGGAHVAQIYSYFIDARRWTKTHIQASKRVSQESVDSALRQPEVSGFFDGAYSADAIDFMQEAWGVEIS